MSSELDIPVNSDDIESYGVQGQDALGELLVPLEKISERDKQVRL